MGIFSRLESVISNYLNDFGEQTNSHLKSFRHHGRGDPDLDAAYEELDDFLNSKEPRFEKKRFETQGGAAKTKLPPEELRADFEKLGVPFGADEETCKAAYKKLLKIHHPDRHAGHEGNYKKATAKSSIINAAWDRIEKWQNEKNAHAGQPHAS